MICHHIGEGVTICEFLYFLTIYHDRSDGKTVIRNDSYGQALAVVHVGGACGSDATALAGRCGYGVAVLGESDREGVVGLYVGERPVVLCSLLLTINRQIVNIVTLFRCDGTAPTVTAKHLAGTVRSDAASRSGRGRDGIAVAHEGGRQGMVGGDAAEGVFGDSAAIHAIHKHRVGMVALVRRDGHRQVLAIGRIGGAHRRNIAARASRCGNGVAVLSEGGCKGMVGLNARERPTALRGLLFAVNSQIVDIPAFIGRDGADPVVATKHITGAARTDTAALAGRGRDGVAVAQEGRRQGMVGSDVAEGVFSDSAAKHAVHPHRVGVVALVRRDGHRQALAVGHGGSAGRRNATARASRGGDGVVVLGEGGCEGMVGLHAGERPAVLCSLLLTVNSQIINVPALIRRNGAVPTVAAKYLAGAGRRNATALAGRNNNVILLLQERGIHHIIQ